MIYKQLLLLCFLAAFFSLLLLQHGDVKINSGPKKKEAIFFSCFHWNVNRILAHNKLSLLETYKTTHKCDILCISETYLDSSISVNTTLSLPGDNIVQSDHPNNVVWDGVYLYYKEKLSLKSINIKFLSQ